MWLLDPLRRGRAIEEILARTEYKGWYHYGAENNGFRERFDFLKGNTMVSLKSVDTASTGWLYDMKGVVNDLSLEAKLGTKVDGVVINPVLDIRVAPGQLEDGNLDWLIEYGKNNGVTVTVKEFH